MKTVAPSKPAPVYCANAEFLDHKGITALFGLKRGVLYQLIREGVIETVSRRKPGNTNGLRLFRVASVRKYLNSLAK